MFQGLCFPTREATATGSPQTATKTSTAKHENKSIIYKLQVSSKAFQLHIFFLRFLSIVGYYKILNIVLCVCCSTVSDSCGSMDCSPPGSSNGVSQARVLEWGAISYSEGYSSAFQGLNSHLLHLLRWQADSSPLAPPGTVLLPGKSHGRRSVMSMGSLTVGDD